MSENLCKRHRDLDKYYSSNYLITWCNNVKEEWTEFLHRAFCEVIPNVFENEVTCLDVGCGPSIANVISASRFCNHITMADYLTSNRHEIEKFIHQAEDGFQWQHYFQFCSSLELDTNIEAIITRTRNAIRKVIFCDVTKKRIFEDEDKIGTFDIIIASLIFDVVATSEQMFKQCLSNVLQHLKSNGLTVIQGSIGEHVYTVGSAYFPAMEADEEMLMRIFQELDLEVVRWELCEKITTHYYCILKKNK